MRVCPGAGPDPFGRLREAGGAAPLTQEEIDLAKFLAYFPAEEYAGEEDFAALAALPDFPWKELMEDGRPLSPDALPVPVHRYREEAVEAALNQWAGIGLSGLKDKSGVLYLEEYHSFYNFTSDFGPGIFVCEAGEAEGDTARLWTAADEEGNRAQLTMERRDGSWYIRAFSDDRSWMNWE